MRRRRCAMAFLEAQGRPVAPAEIYAGLGLKGAPRRQAMRKRLAAMCRDGQLLANRKGEYCLTARIHLVTGTVQGHRDGFGFLIPDDGSDDVFLTARQMREQLDLSTAEIGLTVRTTNCLEEKGIFTVRDLLNSTPKDLLEISNFGEKTLEEVYASLEKIGYSRPRRQPSSTT